MPVKKGFSLKTNAENLENFTHATVDFEFFLGDGYQQVDADSDPDLSLYGID